jgi:hypothetical protein
MQTSGSSSGNKPSQQRFFNLSAADKDACFSSLSHHSLLQKLEFTFSNNSCIATPFFMFTAFIMAYPFDDGKRKKQ